MRSFIKLAGFHMHLASHEAGGLEKGLELGTLFKMSRFGGILNGVKEGFSPSGMNFVTEAIRTCRAHSSWCRRCNQERVEALLRQAAQHKAMGPVVVFLREVGCQHRQQSPPLGTHGRARGHRTAMMVVGAQSAAKIVAAVAVLRELAECHALLAGCDYTMQPGGSCMDLCNWSLCAARTGGL